MSRERYFLWCLKKLYYFVDIVITNAKTFISRSITWVGHLLYLGNPNKHFTNIILLNRIIQLDKYNY